MLVTIIACAQLAIFSVEVRFGRELQLIIEISTIAA
jgi:hypothetical protein